MRKVLLLIILAGILNHASGQDRPFLFKVDYPDYVPKNSSFEISTITRTTDPDCNVLYFYLLVDDYVDLEKITYIDDIIKKELKFSPSKFHEFYGKVYRTEINFDSLGLTHEIFYQLILTLSADNQEDVKIGFGFECKYPKNKVKVYSSYDFFTSNNPLPVLQVHFYDPQPKAGGAIVLKPQSYLNLNFNTSDVQENLLFEFWANTTVSKKPFFKLLNISTGETLVNLFVNENHFLSTSASEDIELFNDCFVSNNSWTYYSAFLSNTNTEITVRANDIVFLKKKLNTPVYLKDISLNLMNNSRSGSNIFDVVKVWDYRNTLELSMLNKHYRNYTADSSKLYVNFDFDDDAALINIPVNSVVKPDYNNIKYSRSNAPIFSKAPELDVVIYGGFYSIEWKQRELSLAREFYLERSYNGGNFEVIHSVFADEDLNKKYFYSDEKRPDNEIVYYRLKQVNKGGSNVYSSIVKIGQVEQLTFELEQNFPNPFNPETRITIEMLEQDEVEIFVYDLVGKKIEKLYEGSLGQGRHSFTFNASNLPSGIYFFEAKTPTASVVRKMILTK